MKPAQVKPPISPDLLNQIDVRVGTILSVTDVPNSEKLVALEVSFGDHSRTILAGLKRERADPRDIRTLGRLRPGFHAYSRVDADGGSQRGYVVRHVP